LFKKSSINNLISFLFFYEQINIHFTFNFIFKIIVLLIAIFDLKSFEAGIFLNVEYFIMDSLMSSLVSTEFSTAINNSVKVDRKLFEKINKLSKKVLKYSRSGNLNLVNSPPFIIEILQDMCAYLNSIQLSYEKKMQILSDIEYFKIFTCNLIEKLKKIIELFKKSSKTIYNEDSEARALFTKYTLNLSHMLAELKSLFPKDVFEGESFQIVKLDAAEFWRKNFNGKAIVSWNEFENKLDNEHKISSKTEAAKLRLTVQLTDSSHVSIFEFDIFTRFFHFKLLLFFIGKKSSNSILFS